MIIQYLLGMGMEFTKEKTYFMLLLLLQILFGILQLLPDFHQLWRFFLNSLSFHKHNGEK